jgi:nitroreductase
MGFNKGWAGDAPVLILGVTASAFTRNDSPNAYALFDLGAATSYLTLQAAALGLTTHQMAGYDHEAARQALEIPDSFALGSIVALGYQGEPERLADEQLREREIKPRERKPLSEIAYSAWGVAAELG